MSRPIERRLIDLELEKEVGDGILAGARILSRGEEEVEVEESMSGFCVGVSLTWISTKPQGGAHATMFSKKLAESFCNSDSITICVDNFDLL